MMNSAAMAVRKPMNARFDHTTIAGRITSLRQMAESDPQMAQDAVWAWLARVGRKLPDAAAEAELAEMFGSGTPGDSVDGQTEGVVVGWTRPDPRMDRMGRGMRAFGEVLMKRTNLWLGKRFMREEKRGSNTVTAAGLVVKLFAPTYRLRKFGVHYEGFDMRTWIEPSSLDPSTRVLVIDYQKNNPAPMTRIRDELVEIVPHTYLGKMIWRQEGGNRLLAYFALRTSVEM